MSRKCVLEISVETVERAVAAERGGADRIELCADLSVGGLTPTRELLRSVREKVRIPIFSMIRPRQGNFVHSATEFREMQRSIAAAREAGMDGVVLGVLHADCRVDVERTRELAELAGPLQVTYHRAFDETTDLRQALEDVIQSGAKRILTSGGAKSALEGAAVLSGIVAAAGDRVTIVPGAGITARNIEQVARQTGAREFHSGLSATLPYDSKDYMQFEEQVRNLEGRLARVGEARITSG